MQRRACYLALGVTVEGERDVLDIWFQQTEGAKFWMQVLSELKQRGLRDILICCVLIADIKGTPVGRDLVGPRPARNATAPSSSPPGSPTACCSPTAASGAPNTNAR